MDSNWGSSLFLAGLTDGISVSNKTIYRPFPGFPNILRSVGASPVHLFTMALIYDPLALTCDVSPDGNLLPSEGDNHLLDDSNIRITSVWTESASHF